MIHDEDVEAIGTAIDNAIAPPMSQHEAREFVELVMSDCRSKIEALTDDIGDRDEYPNYKF